MNWKGVANWALSGVGAFLAGFLSVPMFVEGAPMKVQLSTGAAAGMASMVMHLRKNPLKLADDKAADPKEAA